MVKNVKRQEWTADDVRELKQLAKAKMPASQIARKLNRTEGSCRQKALTLNLSLNSRGQLSKDGDPTRSMTEKNEHTMIKETKKRGGADWKKVNISALPENLRTEVKGYLDKYVAANEAGRNLKDCLERQWDEKFPNGIDGKVVMFNVLNGNLLYAVKDKDKIAERKLKGGDGDDVFACLGEQRAPLQAVSGGKT